MTFRSRVACGVDVRARAYANGTAEPGLRATEDDGMRFKWSACPRVRRSKGTLVVGDGPLAHCRRPGWRPPSVWRLPTPGCFYMSYKLRTRGGRARFSAAGPGCPSALWTAPDGPPGPVGLPSWGPGAAEPCRCGVVAVLDSALDLAGGLARRGRGA